MTDEFKERRKPMIMVLEPEQAKMLKDTHDTVIKLNTLVAHEKLGIICLLQKHEKTLYGNGYPGLKVQTAFIWILVGVLGTESSLVQKLVKMWWK